MKVELISHTPNALDLLLYTKNTRLQGQQTLKTISNMTRPEKLEHLAYMRDTIKSSWEFIDYVFEITGVSRAFTHQFVRTRTGSYAQQSQRTVNVSENSWINPDEDKYDIKDNGPDLIGRYETIMAHAMVGYSTLIKNGMEVQDARGVLPTNIETSIIAKFDLRTLHQMAEVRLCTKTQGEYQKVFQAMKAAVVEVHPWAEDFINVFCANHGTCCFPRFTECPIQKYTYSSNHQRHHAVLDEIKDEHSLINFEANPVAMRGRTDGS